MADLQRRSGVPQKAVTQELTEVAIRNKANLIRGGAVVVGIGVLAVAAPLVSVAVSAGMGILTLGAMALVGIGVIQMLPLIGQKWENKLWAMRKQEARDNPIEQMERRLISKKESFNAFKQAMKLISGQISRQESRIEQRRRVDPSHDLSMEMRLVGRMKEFYQKNLDRGLQAEKLLGVFEQTVDRAKFQYEFVQDGTKILQGLKSIEGGDTQEEMLTMESLNEVERQFDTIFGEIEVEAVFGQAKKIQAAPGKDAIDVEFEELRKVAEREGR